MWVAWTCVRACTRYYNYINCIQMRGFKQRKKNTTHGIRRAVAAAARGPTESKGARRVSTKSTSSSYQFSTSKEAWEAIHPSGKGRRQLIRQSCPAVCVAGFCQGLDSTCQPASFLCLSLSLSITISLSHTIIVLFSGWPRLQVTATVVQQLLCYHH
jgi:hypothetical protein